MTVLGAPCPILRIFDEAKAREFYIDFLEFEVQFEHRFEPDMPLYMGVIRGDCLLHLSEHFGDSTPGQRLRIQIDDLNAYMARLRAKNYRNARPGDGDMQPWGELETTIADPFGNKLTFFENPDEPFPG